MENQKEVKSRVVLAHTLYSNNSSTGSFGFVKPLAEIIDEKLVELNAENFCPTMKVFITSQYDELEKKFQNHEIFRMEIVVSERMSENVDPTFACKYVSGLKSTEAIKPKEYFEIIQSELPDSNERIIEVEKILPGTRYIFVDDGNSIYGPLKWTSISEVNPIIRLEFIDGPLPGVKLAQYQMYKIDSKIANKQIIKSKDGSQTRGLTQGLSIIVGSEFHDYASDDEVVRYCAKLASENNIKVVEKSKMDALGAYLLKNPKLNFPLIKQRISRLPEIALNISNMQNLVIDNLNDYLGGDNGRAIVSSYVEKNSSNFLETLKKERESELNVLLESKREEIKAAELRLKELNESKIALSVRVEEIKNATKQEAVLDSARAQADIKLREKKQELVDLDNIISEKKEIADGLISLENIHQKIASADQNQKYLWKRESDLKSIIDNLQSQLGSTEDSLRKKLTELKPFVEAINGAFAISDVAHSEISVKTNDHKSNEMLVVRQRELIAELKARMSKSGRPISDWQLANILISTQQSFISFLAGLPGVGKTSLARLLSELQNIKPRMREVSVARGWTSQKDLIGFFNPLTGKFQPSNNGLYNFLMPLSTESRDHNQAMAYVLLDEANLSPIEHYWSSFMGMTDGEGDRILMLGQDRLQIPSCLRFIATINYDSTTEPLSPRVVDRSPIILIEPTEFDNIESDTSNDSPALSLPFSAIQMQELFGNATSIPELESVEKSTLDKIKKTLLDSDPSLGRPISISPRKEIAIRQYCSKARGIMNAENEFLALDIAVLQHVLPLIRGNGPRFAKRLDILRRDLETSGLEKSEKFVSKMISFGEIDLHTYDFFCW